IVFRTDYLPLDRMAGKGQVDRIKVNTLNPDAEEKIASQERQARLAGARAEDTAREKGLDDELKSSPSAPSAPETPAKGGAEKPKETKNPPAGAKPGAADTIPGSTASANTSAVPAKKN